MRNSDEPERFLFCFPDFLDKVEATGLTQAEQGAWIRLLLQQLRWGYTYSAFHPKTDFPKRHIRRFVERGLLKERDGQLHVVNWEDWNGRKEWKRLLNRERQQRFRDRKKLPT